MRRILTVLALVAAFVGAVAIAPTHAAQAQTTSPLTVPVSGSATNELGQLVTFTGTFTLQRFVVQNGQLFAVGRVVGTATNTVTGATQTVNQLVTLPVTNLSGTCQILHLELGPINLDVLGLRIQTNRIVLDITAQSGPGNLLGNLLCGITGLLDANAPANAVTRVLNQLLGLLG